MLQKELAKYEDNFLQKPSTWVAVGGLFGAASVMCYHYAKHLEEEQKNFSGQDYGE